MIINSQNLRDLQRGFKTAFQGGFAGITPAHTRITTVVPSSTAAEDYGWIGDLPSMREWIGPRVINSIRDHGYTIRNKEWELSVSVPRSRIEDDQHGIYTPLLTEMGRSTAAHPDELVWDTFANGFTLKGYDGKPFFADNHPVIDPKTGKPVNTSNLQTGAGKPWFLVDTSRALKPIIFQSRKAPEFVAKDNPDDERVFDRNEFVYGTHARYNVGFGFWQMAFASKADLNSENLRNAILAMEALTSDNGKKLGIKPNLIIVGSSNKFKANDLLKVPTLAAGGHNPDFGLVEILEAPLLD